jgi:hypothetical protein
VVTGNLTYNGATVTGAGSAFLFLRNAEGDSANLGNTSSGTFSARVIPGTYDLYYQINLGGASVPSNTSARLGCFTVP